jgi:hypothetical protein
MTIERDQKMLEEYVDWKAKKTVTNKATTAEQFLIERAQEQALANIESALVYIRDESNISDVQRDKLTAILTGNE